MKPTIEDDVRVHIATSANDREQVHRVVSRVYGGLGLRRRSATSQPAREENPGTQWLLVSSGATAVGAMAMTADAFMVSGRGRCSMELEAVYRLDDCPWRNHAAEISRLAVLRAHRNPSVLRALYGCAIELSERAGIDTWIGEVDCQTDCITDAMLMARVMEAKGLVSGDSHHAPLRDPVRAIPEIIGRADGEKPFYTHAELTRLPVSTRVSGFARSLGAKVVGPVALHPVFHRWVVLMMTPVATVAAIQALAKTPDTTEMEVAP